MTTSTTNASEQPRTIYDKIWDAHLIGSQDNGSSLIYIDRHLVHEVTSPQAFEGLRLAGRKVHQPSRTLAVVAFARRCTSALALVVVA